LRFGGSVAVTSDYVVRGITQSRGKPVAQADLHVRPLEDWTLGVWASQVELLPDRHSAEVDVYTEYRWVLPREFTVSAGAVYYTYPGDPRPVTYHYTEFNGSLRWRDRLTLSGAWMPSVTLFGPGYGVQHDRRAWSAELTGNQRMPGQFVATAGIGYYDVPGLRHAGYAYGSAGIMRRFGRWRADVTWIAVQAAEHRRYTPGAAGGPLTASVAWQF
jgi:uncharacterized protein (TIGR02001 family)